MGSRSPESSDLTACLLVRTLCAVAFRDETRDLWLLCIEDIEGEDVGEWEILPGTGAVQDSIISDAEVSSKKVECSLYPSWRCCHGGWRVILREC